jgi:hypothetical protein
MSSLTLAIAGTFCELRFRHIEWRNLAPRISGLNNALEKCQTLRHQNVQLHSSYLGYEPIGVEPLRKGRGSHPLLLFFAI